MRQTAVLLLLLLGASLQATAQDLGEFGFDRHEDSQGTQRKDEPIQVSKPGGQPVLLTCHFELVENKRQRVTWFYKRCGDGMNIPPCAEFSSDPRLAGWQLVSCGGLPCSNRTLLLPEPTTLDNGLYRCSVNRRGKSTYELSVKDKVAAAILSISDNETVWVGQSARLQCRFKARVPPIVRWLLLQSAATVAVSFNDTFLPMGAQSHSTVAFEDGVYVSKLEFAKAALSDSGIYVCLVLTNLDVVFKQARLTVLPKYLQDVTNLHWLFLVPLALALVPAFTWLVCAWRRGQKVRAEKYAPVTT